MTLALKSLGNKVAKSTIKDFVEPPRWWRHLVRNHCQRIWG